MKITIAICTRRRPIMLRRTLDAFTNLQTEGFAFGVVVVENDDSPANRALVGEFADRLDIRYAHEPRQGLCFARNRSFDEAMATGADWIATTDDDTWPEPDWLRRLLDMATSAPGIDAVAGLTRTPDRRRGRWSLPERTTQKIETGAPATYMSTSNFFLSRAVIEEGFRFDPAYNLTGGEDTEFLRALRVAGKRVLWTNEAIVNAPIAEDRKGLRVALRRQIAGYSQMPSIRRKYDGAIVGSLKTLRRMLRLAARALIWLPAGLVNLALRREAGPRYLMRSLDAGATALGLFLGLIGYRVQAYRETDGN